MPAQGASFLNNSEGNDTLRYPPHHRGTGLADHKTKAQTHQIRAIKSMATLDDYIQGSQTAGVKGIDGVTVITYYIPQAGESFTQVDKVNGGYRLYASDAWSTDETSMLMSAMGRISDVANIRFEQVNTPTANFKFVKASIPVAPNSKDIMGMMGFPNGNPQAGIAVFDPANIPGWPQPNVSGGNINPGSIAFETVLHEIGHGLGLYHTHETGSYPGNKGPFLPGTMNLNWTAFSMMSYVSGYDAGGAVTENGNGFGAAPGAIDIAALRDMYGAASLRHQGDDVYDLASAKGWGAIYDTGGMDTIVYSGSTGVTIDLRPATLNAEYGGGGFISSVGSRNNGFGANGFTIANGVTIENAAGGAGADLLYGNASNNLFVTGAGIDSVVGGGGTDTVSWRADTQPITIGATVNGTAMTWLVQEGSGDIDSLQEVEALIATSQSDLIYIDQAAILGITNSSTLGRVLSIALGSDQNSNDALDLSTTSGPYTLTQNGGTLTISNALTAVGVEEFRDGTQNTSIVMGGVVKALMGGGSDSVTASAGADIMDGGTNVNPVTGIPGAGAAAESDSLSYLNSPQSVVVNLLTGQGSGGYAQGDTFSGFEYVIGSSQGDEFFGSGAAETIRGGGGRDTYHGSAGSDIFIDSQGGLFDYSASPSAISFSYGGASQSNHYAFDAGQMFYGTGGDAQGDIISTGYADGTGFNPLWIIGSSGNDKLTTTGWVRADFHGGEGDDVLTGGIGYDRLFGGSERDTITPGAGWDYIDFGEGGGTLVIEASNGAIPTHIMGSGYVEFYTSNGSLFEKDIVLGDYDTWQGVGNVTGTDNCESFINASRVWAGGGNDTIVMEAYKGGTYANGGAGDDTIRFWGNVLVEGGAGADTITSLGAGTLSYQNSPSAITITSGRGTGGDAEGDIINSALDAIVGSSYDDIFSGSSYARTIYAGMGDDRVLNFSGIGVAAYGGADNDYMSGRNVYGEGGNDTIVGYGHGGDDADTMLGTSSIYDGLWGDAGNDVFRTFAGNDFVYMGSGIDTFQYAYGDGVDEIYEFTPGEDKLEILSASNQTVASVWWSENGRDSLTTVTVGWNIEGRSQPVYDSFLVMKVQAANLSSGDFLFA